MRSSSQGADRTTGAPASGTPSGARARRVATPVLSPFSPLVLHIRSSLTLAFLHSDYRGLKKKITAIRRAQEAASDPDTDGDAPLLPLPPSPSPAPAQSRTAASGSVPSTPTSRTAHFDVDVDDDDGRTSTSSLPAGSSAHTGAGTPPRLRRRVTGLSVLTHARSFSSTHGSTATTTAPATPATQGPGPWPWALGAHPPLRELLPRLPPVARSFFDMLDGELDKVESFYCARERELRTR